MDQSGVNPIYRKRYVVEKFLGKGGQAQVYLVKDLQQNNFKALKIIQLRPPYDYSRLSTEPKLVTMLNHQNIIKAYNYFFERKANRFDKSHFTQQLYIILQYVEGGDLNQYLGKLSIEDIKKIYMQVKNGLLYLHSKGIIHRDIGLKNILLDKKKNVKIIDFGISSQINHKQTTFTIIGCGTDNYKPPELLNKLKIKSVKGDLWAVGVMMLELILGKHIHQIQNLKDIIPGSEETFPQIIFKSQKIPKIFLPVLKSLLMRQYAKREFIDIQNGLVIPKSEIEKNNYEILNDDYLVQTDILIHKNEQGIIIYKGLSKKKNIEVAIKIIEQKMKQENIITKSNKIILMKLFSHVNILQILDLIQVNQKIYVISEYCQNKDLDTYTQSKKLNQLEVFQLIYETVTALAEMNKSQYFHRNINPKNIYIKANGESRLAGFDYVIKNAAKNIKQLYQYDFVEYDNEEIIYVAPNLLRKQAYSGLCDVWSLGCVVYEILIGKKLCQNVKISNLLKQQEQIIIKIMEISEDQIHPFFKYLLSNMLLSDENNRSSFISIQRHLNTNKQKVLIQLENRKSLDKIFKYIDFLHDRASLLIECADLLKGSYHYPIEDFRKYVLIYLLYGRYLHVLDQMNTIINQNIIKLPDKQNINIKNFDEQTLKLFKKKAQIYINDIIHQTNKYMDIIVIISKDLFGRKKKNKKLFTQYQYMFNILEQMVTSNQLKQSNSFFVYNYKLFLFNECRLKHLQQIGEEQLKIYNFCLKLVNINNTLNQQNYMDENYVKEFVVKNMEIGNKVEIIKNIQNIHVNVEGEY